MNGIVEGMGANNQQQISWIGDPIANWSIALRDAREDGDVQRVASLLAKQLARGPRIPEIEGGRFPAIDDRRAVQHAMEDAVADIAKYHGFDEFEESAVQRLSWAMANYMEGLCNHIRMNRHSVLMVKNRCNWLHAAIVTLLRNGRFTVKPKRGLRGILQWYDEKYRQAAMKQEASAAKWVQLEYAGGARGDFVESDDEEKAGKEEMKEDEKVDVGGGGGDVVVEVKVEGMEDMTVDGVDDRMEGGRIEKDGTVVKEDEEEEREEDYDFMLTEDQFADRPVGPDYAEIRRVEEMKRQKKEEDERREKRRKEEKEKKELVDRMNREWDEKERMLVEGAKRRRCERLLREHFRSVGPPSRMVKKAKRNDEQTVPDRGQMTMDFPAFDNVVVDSFDEYLTEELAEEGEIQVPVGEEDMEDGEYEEVVEEEKGETMEYTRDDYLFFLRHFATKYEQDCQEIREQQQLIYSAAKGKLQQEQLQLLQYLQQQRDIVDEEHKLMMEYLQNRIMALDEQERELQQQLQALQPVQQLQRRFMGGNIVEEEDDFEDEEIEYDEDEEEEEEEGDLQMVVDDGVDEMDEDEYEEAYEIIECEDDDLDDYESAEDDDEPRWK